MPLRGYKFQTYEGGHRVPCIMRWPGVISAGTESDEPIGTIDIFPTMAKRVGADLPKAHPIDGRDAWPVIAGETGAKSSHDLICYYRGTKHEAVRMGKWKLRVTGKRSNASTVELYNLRADIGEKENLAEHYPERGGGDA